MKNRATANQKHTVDSKKTKRREHKHEIKGNHQTTERKTKRKEQRRNKESTGKQGLIWQ